MARSQGEAADGGADEFEPGGDGEVDEIEEVEVDETEGDADGGEDDGAEGDGDDASEGEQEAPPQRRVAARETRWQKRERELNELRDEVRQLRERPAQPTQPTHDPQAAQRAEQEFQERLRLMDPSDAIIAVRDRERALFSQAFTQMQGQNLDRMDKSQFDAEARTDAARRRLGPEVERYIGNARQMGNWQITRENVFHLLYGQELDRRRREAAPRQQRAAQRRVASQTTRPGSGRGEAARGDRRPAEDADEALLRSVTVSDL